jgi:hypothetical protein
MSKATNIEYDSRAPQNAATTWCFWKMAVNLQIIDMDAAMEHIFGRKIG